MLKADLNQLVTIGDLEDFYRKIRSDLQQIMSKQLLGKKFYTPKEFCHITGQKYSTVIHKCKTGKLRSRQDDAGCSWQIFASEIERYEKEAEDIYSE